MHDFEKVTCMGKRLHGDQQFINRDNQISEFVENIPHEEF